MMQVQGEGGLQPALLPARLVQLVGAGRLSCVHAIMDSLRGAPASAEPWDSAALRRALAEQLSSPDEALDAIDLVDRHNQDVPLAIFLLTHPALPRGAAPLLLLRTLAGWQPAALARLTGMTPERVRSRLNAGIRRMRILRLGVAWPHLKELSWRVRHSIEVIEQLDTLGRNRRSRRNGTTCVCECARSLLEALALNPITRSPWVMERWRRIRYAESVPVEPGATQPFLLHGGTTPFIRA
jgi:hypothetical protein